MKIRVTRPRRQAGLISADAFDRLFERELGARLDLRVEPLEAWCDAILGPAERPLSETAAAEAFSRISAETDFLCPGYELIPLAPLLLKLRELSGSAVRLLLIAHAPGAYALEWVLLRPLLAPGDRIVAPTRSARDTIGFLCPDLLPFVTVIPHPMPPLPHVPPQVRPPSPLLVSLGRLDETKLIHREVWTESGWRSRVRSTRRVPPLRRPTCGPFGRAS
jgi:hypothetical protein